MVKTDRLEDLRRREKDAFTGALMLLVVLMLVPLLPRRADAVKKLQRKSPDVPEKMYKTSRKAKPGLKWMILTTDLLMFFSSEGDINR